MEAMVFYVAAAVTLMASLLVITRRNAVHALLYLVVTLLSLAPAFVAFAAPFAAALQVIVYAGAIMVLFVFVIMMLNLGEAAVEREREWLPPGAWRGPLLLGGVLVVEFLLLLPRLHSSGESGDVHAVGLKLFGPYLVAVEAASLLLLASLVAAWHLGRPDRGEGRG